MLKNLFLQKNVFDSFFDVGGKVLKATELLRNRERERERESGDCRPSPRSAPLWRSGELEIMNEGKTLFPSHWPLPLPAQLLILETRCHNGLHLPARVFHQFTIIALINIEYRKKILNWLYIFSEALPIHQDVCMELSSVEIILNG